MMTNRAIVMFPKFRNIEVIDKIRSKYDPLFSYIAPHITLIFPFQSDISKEMLIEHLENQLREVIAFDLVLKGVTGAADGYIFLDVKTGNDNVIHLHDKLYSGILKDYHNRVIPYIPHITIAKIKDEKTYTDLVDELKDFDVEFSTVIDSITIEIIDATDKSIEEYEYKLQVANRKGDNDD